MELDFGQASQGQQNNTPSLDFDNPNEIEDEFKDDTVYPADGVIDNIKLALMDAGLDFIRPEAEDMKPGQMRHKDHR